MTSLFFNLLLKSVDHVKSKHVVVCPTWRRPTFSQLGPLTQERSIFLTAAVTLHNATDVSAASTLLAHCGLALSGRILIHSFITVTLQNLPSPGKPLFPQSLNSLISSIIYIFHASHSNADFLVGIL